MNTPISFLTSVQLLAVGIFAFLIITAVAVWFFAQASKPEDHAPAPADKKPDPNGRHFIPVVVPVRKQRSGPNPPASPPARVAPPIEREVAPPPPLPPLPASPSVGTGSSPSLSTAESVETPASRHFKLVADVRHAGDGTPTLFLRCRGFFPDILFGRMFFEVDFSFAERESAQVRTCPRLGSGWIPLRIRRIYDGPLDENEWCELGEISLRDLAGPCSGTHLVQATCSAYACSPDVELAEVFPVSEAYCSVGTSLSIPFVGMGYDDFAAWLTSHEKALGVAISCATDEGPNPSQHEDVIRRWIMEECGALDAHPEFKRAGQARLSACLDASHFGNGTTAAACHELVGLVAGSNQLLDSLGELFASFGESEGLSAYAIERITNACLWLGIPCPGAIELARIRLAAKPPPTLRTEEPVVVPAKGASSAGFPFTVSLSLIGTPESAVGFRVMVSGDLPVRSASGDDLFFAVSVSDADDKAMLPFLVSASEVDGINEVIKPSVTIPRDQYDPSAPRQVAEIIFKDCAFPRHGERTIQVSCVGYSLDGKAGLTRLCYGDASGTVKISGTGYVTLRKRRRAVRGLMLELALAAGTAGSVTLAQKTIAKEWITAQAAGIVDPDERRLTVNYLTKALLGIAALSQAEIVALALRLAGYRQPKLSNESLRLARQLAEAKPASLSKVALTLDKVRKELGLPAAAVAKQRDARPVAPVVRPVQPKVKPVRVSLGPRQLRARVFGRKLARSLPGWKTMSGPKKIAHLRDEILSKSAKMANHKGLAERHALQSEINDMSELVVMLRAGAAS